MVFQAHAPGADDYFHGLREWSHDIYDGVGDDKSAGCIGGVLSVSRPCSYCFEQADNNLPLHIRTKVKPECERNYSQGTDGHENRENV